MALAAMPKLKARPEGLTAPLPYRGFWFNMSTRSGASPAEPDGTKTASSDPLATHIFDSAEALAIALSSATRSPSSTAMNAVKRDAICVPQPSGISHTSVPDDAAGFVSDAYYHDVAISASTPSGWVQAFTGLNASNSAERCLGFTLLASYDVQICANKCATLPSCDSINMYFERDPSTSINNSTCTNPPGITNVKCVFWKGAVGTANANNFGQRREGFQVVVAGSSGYMKEAFAAALPVVESLTSTVVALPTTTHMVDVQDSGPVSASTKSGVSFTVFLTAIILALSLGL
ncbi:hypothetical protein E4T49_08149 [Aureobasidium sp. EXF-10728]|nr:hypothetical protein E4T49_08149 [Aureobasidium sp. EXF-10728]